MQSKRLPVGLAFVFAGLWLASVVPANAAAFLWISAANWSYAGTACGSSSSAVFSWFLATGPGATAAAYSSCSNTSGSSAAFAVARSGTGGAGAAFHKYHNNIYGGNGLDTTLVDSVGSESYKPDDTNASSEFNSGFTITATGISFGSDFSAESHDVTRIQAFYYSGPTDQTDLCGEFHGTSCGSGQSSYSGDLTSLNTLQTSLGLGTALGAITDPTGGTSLTFSAPLTGSTSDVILVGEGTAVPEPSSLLLVSSGLLGLAAILARRQGAGISPFPQSPEARPLPDGRGPSLRKRRAASRPGPDTRREAPNSIPSNPPRPQPAELCV